MTTNNHTAITTGAAANAATINSPLAELDAAIGDLSALSTTEQGSLVGAANELYLEIDRGNIVYDPFHLVVPPGVDFGNRKRWLNANVLTAIYGDTNNPYGGVTIRYSGYAAGSTFAAGKIVWLDEIGAQVGQKYLFSCTFKATAGQNYRLWHGIYNAAGTLQTSLIGDIHAATGSAQTITTGFFAIPAGAMGGYYAFGIRRGDGSAVGDVDIYAFWGQRDVAYALPTRSFVEVPAPSVDEVVVRAINLNGQLAKIETGESETAIIAIIGDSWQQHYQWPHFLRDRLQAEYGDAGYGWISASEILNSAISQPVAVRTKTGTWTDVDETGFGPDLNHMASTDDSTPASMTFTVETEAFVIFYRVQPDGGEFRYRVDAGGWTTVDTDGTAALDTVTISGLSAASHALEIELVSAGAAGVILIGVDAQKSAPGVRVHKLGNGGSYSADWIGVDADEWQAALTELNPHLVTILTGTNEQGAALAPATFFANLLEMIDRVRAAVPYADIVLISSGDNDRSTTYQIREYDWQMRRCAQIRQTMFISLYDFFGTPTAITARDLYLDQIHPNDAGYYLIARLVGEKILI